MRRNARTSRSAGIGFRIDTKNAVDVVIDFIDVVINGLFSDDSAEFVLLQIVLIAADEVLVHLGRCLMLQILVNLIHKENVSLRYYFYPRLLYRID